MKGIFLLPFVIVFLFVSCKRGDYYYSCHCTYAATGRSFADKDLGRIAKEDAYAQCRALAPDTVNYKCVMAVIGN